VDSVDRSWYQFSYLMKRQKPGRRPVMTELVEHGQLFIGGELTDPLGKDVIEVISPHTEEVIGRVPHASTEDVDRAVAVARRAFDEGPWPRMSLDERIEVVTRIKDGIAVRHEEIARVISSENGSPYSWSVLAQALGASRWAWSRPWCRGTCRSSWRPPSSRPRC
jgi:acyl-CoA reductase-like NAD-dependent aldehyde dehydrogenase